MDAERLRLQGELAAVDGRKLPVADDPDDAGRHDLGITRLLRALEDQRAVSRVVEIREGLRRDRDAGRLGDPERVLVHEHEHEVGIDFARGFDECLGELRILIDRHVERAVRLDVLDGCADRVGERAQRAVLVHDVVTRFLGRDRHPSPPEPEQVGETHVRADPHAVLLGKLDGRAHDAGVAAVPATRDIGRRDERHHAGVVAELPAAEALSHVAVDVDRHPGTSFAVRRLVLAPAGAAGEAYHTGAPVVHACCPAARSVGRS